MARATITNAATAALITGPAGSWQQTDDVRARTYLAFTPTGSTPGVVLLKPAALGTLPAAVDMSDAARWDFAKAALTYTLEPGMVLFAKAAGATVAVDVLEGGER